MPESAGVKNLEFVDRPARRRGEPGQQHADARGERGRASRASFIWKASRAGNSNFCAARWRTTRTSTLVHAFCAPRRTRSTRQAPMTSIPKLKERFPDQGGRSVRLSGPDSGQRGSELFHAAQQELIQHFVDRRGGGLLFLGGRASLADGGYDRASVRRICCRSACRITRTRSIAIRPPRS